MSKERVIEKNEQVRAIFVLGLLAVLASIRTQNATIMATIGNQEPFNIIGIIDAMIILMSFYALFMIFGYSKDMVGESIADSFKHLGKSIFDNEFCIIGGHRFPLRFGLLPKPIVMVLCCNFCADFLCNLSKSKNVKNQQNGENKGR